MATAPALTSSSAANSQPTGTIEDRIRKPSGAATYISAVIYGKGGVGKTTLLGTMPGKGLVIDVPQVEGGTVVLSDLADRIDVLPATDWRQITDPSPSTGIYQWLLTHPDIYDWVAVDSLTAMQELAKRKVIKERSDTIAADPHQISLQEWGKIGELMKDLVFKFRLLKMHQIFTAQERRTTDDKGTILIPEVSPASLQGILPPMSMVARLFTQETEQGGKWVWERRLRMATHPSYATKTRNVPSRPAPDVVADPNLKDIFAYYILGKKDAKPPRVIEEADESEGMMTMA